MSIEQFDEFLLYTILEFGDINHDYYKFMYGNKKIYNDRGKVNLGLANNLRLVCRKFYYIIRSKPFHKLTVNLHMRDTNGSLYIPRLLFYERAWGFTEYLKKIRVDTVMFPKCAPPTGNMIYAEFYGCVDKCYYPQERMKTIRELRLDSWNMKDLYNDNIVLPKCTVLKCSYFKKEWGVCVPNAKTLLNSAIDLKNLGDQFHTIEITNERLYWDNKKYRFPSAKKVMVKNITDIDDRNAIAKMFPNAVIIYND